MSRPIKYNDIIIAIVVYIVWVLGFSFYTYQKSKTELYENLEEKLVLAAQNYVYLIPDDLHHKNMSKSDWKLPHFCAHSLLSLMASKPFVPHTHSVSYIPMKNVSFFGYRSQHIL